VQEEEEEEGGVTDSEEGGEDEEDEGLEAVAYEALPMSFDHNSREEREQVIG
jgi:hypothetical protein